MNISLSQCRDFEIPIPPIDEQLEIVRRACSTLATADRIEAAILAADETLGRASRGATAAAFRGELGSDIEPAAIHADADGAMSQNGKPALRA